MFDCKREYNRINNLRHELLDNPVENKYLLIVYETVLDVIAADPRFRAKMHIELSIPPEIEAHTNDIASWFGEHP